MFANIVDLCDYRGKQCEPISDCLYIRSLSEVNLSVEKVYRTFWQKTKADKHLTETLRVKMSYKIIFI